MRLLIALLLIIFSAALQAAQPCGAVGERPCGVLERVPSCDKGLQEDFAKGICVAPRPTIDGTQSSANEQGRTRPADCGQLDQRACKVWEFVPSCAQGLLESGGRCYSADPNRGAKERSYLCGDGPNKRPCNCGAYMQRPCNVDEAVPSCENDLVERNSRCEDPNQRPEQCGHDGQRACRVDEFVPSCDGTLVEAYGRCQRSYGIAAPSPAPSPANPANGSACGGLDQRPCRIDERIPSCDAGLKEDFMQGRCVR